MAGLRAMLERGLVEVDISDNGFAYRASESAASFLLALRSEYTLDLRQRADWVVESFAGQSDRDLSGYFNDHLDRWGSEFEMIDEIDDGGRF